MIARSDARQSGAPSGLLGRLGLAEVAAGAMGIWLGLQAMRAFFMGVVWNVGEDLPATQMGLIALCVFVPGLLGYWGARLLGGRRPDLRFILLFGLMLVGRQAFAQPEVNAAFVFIGLILWMWWLPAFLVRLTERGLAERILPGVLLGLVADVSLHTALHGLDLFFLRGVWPLLGGVILAVALIWAVKAAGEGPAASGGEGGRSLPGFSIYAVGPFLVLQMTLLTSLGRIQVMTGWGLVPAAGLSLLGLMVAMAIVGLIPAGGRGFVIIRVVWALASVGLLAFPEWLAGGGVWLLSIIQVGLVMALAAALAPAAGGSGGALRPGRIYGGWVVGALLLFALCFYYYSEYEWPTLWVVAGGLAILPALLPRGVTSPRSALRPALAVALLVGLIGASIGAIGRAGSVAAGPAPAEMTLLNYNIHQGLDYWSMPAIQAVAAFIEEQNTDLVALQEVGRGWDISGGVDLVAYLKWRLPQYQVVFEPMAGDLWGNVILSRYAVSEQGHVRYPIGNDSVPRGLTWAQIPTAAGDLLFVSTHLTAYEGEGRDEDREAQAKQLVDFWKGRSHSVLAGDFNAHPDSPSVKAVVAGGLVDLPDAKGLGERFTYSAGDPYERIDYVFISPDVEAVAASVPETTASDHLPVRVTFRLQPGR